MKACLGDVALDELSALNLWGTNKLPCGVFASPARTTTLRNYLTECYVCGLWDRILRFVMSSSQSTYRCRNTKHVRITRLRRVPSRNFGYPLQPIPDSIWMNKQLSRTGLDGATTIEVCVEGVRQARTGRSQRCDQVLVERRDGRRVAEQRTLW